MAITSDSRGRPKFPPCSKQAIDDAHRRHVLMICAAVGGDDVRTYPEFAEISARYLPELESKWTQLIEYYVQTKRFNLSTSNLWLNIACCLADDFIENFNPARAKRVGRRPGRSHNFGTEFVAAVEKKSAERGRGISDACLQLSKRGPWAGAASGSLETRYYEAKKRQQQVQEAMGALTMQASFGNDAGG